MEFSILAVKPCVDFVSVVYQKISNWGNRCSPHLEDFLEYLKKKGLVDELILYEPKTFSPEEKRKYVSFDVSPQEIGGPIESVMDVFFNELVKRELGRQSCAKANCTHFISMDTDEFYLVEQLEKVKQIVELKNYDAIACR